MNRGKSYREFFERAEAQPEYWIEGAIIEFTEELSRVMEIKGISRAELARRIGSSRAYITKVLRGNANFTFASIVKLARAMDQDIHFHLSDYGSEVRWYDVFDNPPKPPQWPSVKAKQSYSGALNQGEPYDQPPVAA